MENCVYLLINCKQKFIKTESEFNFSDDSMSHFCIEQDFKFLYIMTCTMSFWEIICFRLSVSSMEVLRKFFDCRIICVVGYILAFL